MKWKTSKEALEKISDLADRSQKLAKSLDVLGFNKMHWMMNLEAVHLNGCPLDLDRLATFDDFNFAHDIFGIERYLDKKTGKLRNCFVPRCAKPEPKKENQ